LKLFTSLFRICLTKKMLYSTFCLIKICMVCISIQTLMNSRNGFICHIVSTAQQVSIKYHQKKTVLKGTSSMVCPWLLHGSSIENRQIDGQTMDEPWTNHGGTMDEPWRNHGQTLYLTYLCFHGNTLFKSNCFLLFMNKSKLSTL
jgi:hypothetical protein